MKQYKLEIPNLHDTCLKFEREDRDLYIVCGWYSENTVYATKKEIQERFPWLLDLEYYTDSGFLEEVADDSEV